MKTLYHFRTAARIEAGPHSLNLLGDYLDQIGLNQIRSVFILTQPSIVSLGYADQIKEGLAKKGISSEVNTDIQPEPTEQNIEQVFQLFLKEAMTRFWELAEAVCLMRLKSSLF